MVKILDVARYAGVSTATVSRVLNKNSAVAPDLRDRVEQAVAELGYSLNVAARALRTRRSSKLLVMVPNIANPFFGDVIRGAEEASREAGFSVVLGDTDDKPVLEIQYIAMLDRGDVDGLVILGPRIPDSLRRLMRKQKGGVPVVHGCEYSPNLGVPSVHIDNEGAGRDAMRHLLDLGHRTVGILTGPMESPLSRDRLNGVQAAVAEAGGARLIVRNGNFSIESGYEHAAALARQGATAIFCFSDEMALGALRALADGGLSCPGDVSVMGFDDIRFAAFASPRLTTIRQPAHAIGRMAVELLLRRVEDGGTEVDSVLLPYDLVVRESTAARRGMP